jgi:hypothetical protein
MKVIKSVFMLAMLFLMACEIMPRNTLKDCELQCKDNPKSKACLIFCDCIHQKGHTLDSCLAEYDKAPTDSLKKKIK